MGRPKGMCLTAENKAKISKALKGRVFTKEHREHLGEANRRRLLGKKRPEFSGSKNKRWKGGEFITSGYKYIMVDPLNDIPRRRYQREHILIAEKALGHPLKKGEIVHHINGIKTDNRNSNLLICTQSYHRSLEEKMIRLYQKERFKNLKEKT